MAGKNLKSEIQDPKSRRLVPLMLGWFAANARDLPWRRTHDPYSIWVSEIMLQQTQVKTVIPFWERWLRELPTIEAAASASQDKLHKLWEGLGYYTRVRNLQKAAQVIVEQHGGVFPEQFDDVLALPGIGRYTAGAICSIAFNQPTAILDGNVIRVLTRIFGIAENPKEKNTNQKLWRLAEELVTSAQKHPVNHSSRHQKAPISKPEINQSLLTSAAAIVKMTGNCSALNQSLMELGALVCLPRNAQCPICPVKKLCMAFRENRVADLPNLGRREQATARQFVAFVVERAGKFLVQQRPAGVVNAHLWEFPNVELGVAAGDSQGTVGKSTLLRVIDPRSEAVAEAAREVLGSIPNKISTLVTVKHSITRYRITLEAFRVNADGKGFAQNDAVWKSPAQMQQLAFTSAHRKIMRAARTVMTDAARQGLSLRALS